ncbi:hypothetical protein [Streptomyces sp. NPDC001665]
MNPYWTSYGCPPLTRTVASMGRSSSLHDHIVGEAVWLIFKTSS